MADKKTEETENLLKVSQIGSRIFFAKIGKYMMGDNGDDLYYFDQAVKHLRSDFGDDLLKKEYGKRYDEINKKLETISRVLYKVKLYYDSIYSKKVDEETREKRIKKLYKKELSKLNPIQRVLYDVFYLYIKNTNLKYQTVANTFVKEAQKEITRFDLTKEKEEVEDDDEE